MPRLDPQDLYRRLAALARTQAGYFTAAQAKAAGYSYQAQRYHVERGNWTRVDRGIFRFPEWPAQEHEDLVRWTLWSRGRGIVSHETALQVHDIGDFMPAAVHLTVPPNFSSRAEGIALHVDELPDEDVERREGFAVTTPIRSVLDVAADGVEVDQLGRALSDLLERGLATQRMLRTRADELGPAAALAIERALQLAPA